MHLSYKKIKKTTIEYFQSRIKSTSVLIDPLEKNSIRLKSATKICVCKCVYVIQCVCMDVKALNLWDLH